MPMDAPEEMSHNDVMRVRLQLLREEHRDLDEAINALAERSTADQLALKRLKKQKLVLKDRIQVIQNNLTPDIIA